VALVAHSAFDNANRSSIFSADSNRSLNQAKTAVNWSGPVLALRQGDGQTSKIVARRAPVDVRLPCMLYAAVGAFSGDAGEDTQLAIAQIRKLHGVLHVIRYDGASDPSGPAASAGIAVVTRGYWFSRQALARLMAQCGGTVGMFAWNSQAEANEADARVTRGTAQFVDGLCIFGLPPSIRRAAAPAPRSLAILRKIPSTCALSVSRKARRAAMCWSPQLPWRARCNPRRYK